jgi:hypothetical protein
MPTPSGRNRPPTASAASWRTRWPCWREANLARAEGSLARERPAQLEERLNALQSRVERTEAVARAEAERTRKQLMDSYHELGARTGDFEVPDREPGLRCLEWVQEELQALPTIVEGFMSYVSLVT